MRATRFEYREVQLLAGLDHFPHLVRVHVHRHAAHVVTYGEHVSAHARRLGARRTTIAPQAVDNAFWAADPDPHDTPPPRLSAVEQPFVAMFAGLVAAVTAAAVMLANLAADANVDGNDATKRGKPMILLRFLIFSQALPARLEQTNAGRD